MSIKFLLVLISVFFFVSCSSSSNYETNGKNTVNVSASSTPAATQNTTVANNSAQNKTNSTSSSSRNTNFNPFTGSVMDLMPKQVGEYLYEKPETDTSMKYSRGATDAVKDLYKMKGNDDDSILLSISNYTSSEAAQTSLKKIAGEQSLSTTSKMKNGKNVGLRLSMPNGTNVIWTNGSLLCGVMGNGKVTAQTIKSFEDKLNY